MFVDTFANNEYYSQTYDIFLNDFSVSKSRFNKLKIRFTYDFRGSVHFVRASMLMTLLIANGN